VGLKIVHQLRRNLAGECSLLPENGREYRQDADFILDLHHHHSVLCPVYSLIWRMRVAKPGIGVARGVAQVLSNSIARKLRPSCLPQSVCAENGDSLLDPVGG